MNKRKKKVVKPFYGITRINRKCIDNCVSRGGSFCNMPRTKYGVCCKDAESCKKYKSTFCSFDAPADSETLKFWSCPHTPRYCGQKVRRVADQELRVIEPLGRY